MKQASVKYFLRENFKRNVVDDKQSNIYDLFLILSLLSFPIVMGPLYQKSDNSNI